MYTSLYTLHVYEDEYLDRLQFFDIDHSVKKTVEKLCGNIRELSQYESEPSKNITPVEYWKQNALVYPGLFYCYTKILCLQGSSVKSEQLFCMLATLFGIGEIDLLQKE